LAGIEDKTVKSGCKICAYRHVPASLSRRRF
jgi:hypothetical protein